MIDLKITQELVDQYLKSNFNIDLAFKIKENGFQAKSKIKISGLNDGVIIQLFVFEGESAKISFIFDSLQANPHNLHLINNLNNHISLFTSVINKFGEFEMYHHIVLIKDEKNFVKVFDFLMAKLLLNENIALIKEVTSFTE
jgi:hypothetical protein